MENRTMKYIELTRGLKAIVDDCYFEELNQHNWCAHKSPNDKSYYAVRNTRVAGRTKTIRMHQEVLKLAGVPLKRYTDHRDLNGLNNQLGNLRPATPSQNRCNIAPLKNNRCGYKGVDYRPERNKWRTMICVDKRQRCIGHFDSPEEAARAYDAAARELHGEFAYLNFKDEDSPQGT
jgi:hypothetical protein